MNTLQIDEMNKKIHYLEGKIYFEPNKGYTSNLIKKLLHSYNYSCSTSGIMHYLKDDKNRVVTSAYSWEGLLYNTAIVLR